MTFFSPDVYRRWGAGLVGWLSSLVGEDGVLYDPVDGAPTPDDHYAVTHFALAALKLAETTGRLVSPKALLALDRYLGLAPENLGHFEFNNQAILEISLSPGYRDLPPELRVKIERYLEVLRWQSGFGRNVSNNWLMLRAACHGLNWLRTGYATELKIARRFARYAVKRFQLDDGFFVDYPCRKFRAGYAVPLTYHAATCLGLAVYWDATGDARVLGSLKKALLALYSFISPEGDGFFYGRTNACLISYCYALRPLTVVLDKGAVAGEEELTLRRLLGRLLTGLSVLRREDRSFALNRHPDQNARPAWDDYMHQTVYNAAAAAVFLGSPPAEPVAPVVEPGLKKADRAGFLAVETEGTYAVFSSKGAFVAGQNNLFYGCRYAGCQPLFMRAGELVVVPSPPGPGGRVPDAGLCGFIPFVEVDGVLYAAWVYDEVYTSEAEGAVIIRGRGRLFRTVFERTDRKLLLSKLMIKACQRLKADFFRPTSLEALPGAFIARTIVYLPAIAALVSVYSLTGLPRTARSYTAGARTSSSPDYKYRLVLPDVPAEAVLTEVATSYGRAFVRRFPLGDYRGLVIESLEPSGVRLNIVTEKDEMVVSGPRGVIRLRLP